MYRIQKHAVVIVLITLSAVFAIAQELTVRAAPAARAANQQSVAGNSLESIRDDGGRPRDDFLGEFLLYVPIATHCDILYFDNFSNPNSGWPEADFGSTLFEYRNGEYRLLLRNPFWFAAASPGVTFTDYLLTTDVRIISNKPGTYGLIFGLKSDFSGFYTFEIDNAKNYYIWRWNGAWALLDSGTSAVLKAGLASNTIAVERNGTSIQAFANGELVTSLSSSTFMGSLFFGVVANSGDQPDLDVRYDNYKIEPIGCGLGASVPFGAPVDLEHGVGEKSAPAWLEFELPSREP
jgi:hypothetical protein